MEEYQLKDSGVEWLRYIPEHWKLRKISYLVDVKDGTHDTPSYEPSSEGTYAFVTSKDIVNNEISFDSVKYINKAFYESYIKRSNVTRGDVVMPMIGTIGNAAIVKTDRPFAIKNVALFKTSEDSFLDKKYLAYFIDSLTNKDQFFLISKGGVQSFVSLTTLRNMKVIFPVKAEQKAIANYLDKACQQIDKTLEIKQQQIELLEKYRQSIIHEAVTKGLDKNVPMKDSGVEWLGNIPEYWKIDRLKDVSCLRDKKTDEKSPIYDYLELEDIEQGTGKILNKRNTINVASQVMCFSVGDVLFGKLRPYLTKYYHAEFDGKCTGEILAIEPLLIDGKFMSYYLGSPVFINHCNNFSYGAKMPRINWSTQMSMFPVPLPPTYKEQKAITNYLDKACKKIDASKAVIEQQIETLTNYRKSLIHECVTGKKRVYFND